VPSAVHTLTASWDKACGLQSRRTCQKQSAASGVHLDLCVQLAAGILEPVALVNDDVLPCQPGQPRPVGLAHHEVIAGQQHIEAGIAASNLHPTLFVTTYRTDW